MNCLSSVWTLKNVPASHESLEMQESHRLSYAEIYTYTEWTQRLLSNFLLFMVLT